MGAKGRTIIVLPGYKGSFLWDNSRQKTTWLTPECALFGKNELIYPVGYEIDRAGYATIFTALKIKPFIHIDCYQSLLETLTAHFSPSDFIFPFAYDWRQDFYQQVLNFHRSIQVVLKKPEDNVICIGHSLGGLILAYYLRYGCQPLELAEEDWSGCRIINQAVFIGTPFRGCARIFKDILTGERIGFNKKLLRKEVIQSFPIVYQLIPPKNFPFLYTSYDHQSIDVQSLGFWEGNCLGLFESSFGTVSHPLQKAFVQHNLKIGSMLYDLLHKPLLQKPVRPPRIAILAGEGISTQSKALFSNAMECIWKGDKRVECPEGFEFEAEGDGVVTLESAGCPKAFSPYVVHDKRQKINHSFPFKNRQVREWLMKILAEE